METNKNNQILWKRIAQIAAAFAFFISILLIVNYIQYQRVDPVETKLINNLVLRLNDTPEDTELRNEIRSLDLLVRKAYFTSQWQLRTGGYFLLLCIGVLVIAMQMLKSKEDKSIVMNPDSNSFLTKKKARIWVSVGGAFILITALTFAFLSHQELSTKFAEVSTVNDVDEELISENDDVITKDDVSTTEEIVKEKIEAEQVVEIDLPEEKEVKTESPKEIEKEKVQETKSNPVAVQDTKVKKEIEEEKVLATYPSEEDLRKNHPSFRGPGGLGISYHKNIPTQWDASTGENILWKTEIPLHGYNSPIIWNDKVFLSGANSEKREIYCINKSTGEIIWTHEVKNIDGSPAKSPKVTEDTGQAAPSLTTDGQLVFALFANGDLIALNFEGKKAWSKNLGNTGNHYGHSSSLMLYQDILILQYDTQKAPRLLGLSSKTGEIVWSTPRKVKVSWASPSIVNTGNKTEVFIASDPIVSSFDPKTGKENWQLKCIYGEVGPSVGYADGVVYAVNEYAKLVAIKNGDKPEILWESDEYLSDVPSPVATKDLLFMATSYGVMVCYNAKTGDILWEHEFDNGFYSSPMMVEGKIYLMDMSGIMHVFEAANEYKAISSNPLGEDAMTTPAFSNGKIFIRGNKHLFCVGK